MREEHTAQADAVPPPGESGHRALPGAVSRTPPLQASPRPPGDPLSLLKPSGAQIAVGTFPLARFPHPHPGLVTVRVQVAASHPQRARQRPAAPTPGRGPRPPRPTRSGAPQPRGEVEPSTAPPCPILLLLAALIPLLGVLKVMFSVSGNILHDTSEAEASFRGI